MDEKVEINENTTENQPKKTIRDSIYKNIDISVASMDKFITAMMILLVLALGIAIFTR
ncbi:MAG: hypothetical protein ACRC41_13810 [Sarcina sp.]